MEKIEIFENAINYFINEDTTITKTCVKFKIKQDDFIKFLHSKKYYKAALKISKKSILKFYNAAEEYASLEYGEKSRTELCKKYGISKISEFTEYLKTYYPETNTFDDTMFDSIDTEEKAYWLGFLYADGYINSSPIDTPKRAAYSVSLDLSIKDFDHVQKFANFLKSRRPVKDEITRARFSVNSKNFWTVLNDYGCTPRKSLTLKFPKKNVFKNNSMSRKELIRHFIRGYFDGDGCITYKRENYPTISLISTDQFLMGIQNVLNTHKTLYLNSKNNDITKVLKFNGEEAYKILNYLYNNCNIYLQRKYDKYKDICRLYEKSYRGLQTNNGEDCDVNPVITGEIKESSAS